MPTKLILHSAPLPPPEHTRPEYPTASVWLPLDEGSSPFANLGTAGGTAAITGGTVTTPGVPGLSWANPAIHLNSANAQVSGTLTTYLEEVESFTISWWSNLVSAPDNHVILSSYDIAGWLFRLYMVGGQLTFDSSGPGFTGDPFSTGISAVDLTSGNPVFVALSIDGNTGGPNPILYSYLNGLEIANKSYPYLSNLGTPAGTFAIGQNGPLNSVDGYITNVVVDASMTPGGDILLQYNQGKP